MSLLLLMPERDTSELLEGLTAALPGAALEVWPRVDAPQDVEMAVVWNHPPGTLTGFPRLRLVCSYGAGVDHLLRDPQLPAGVQITRLVDPNLVGDMVEFVVGVVCAQRRDFAAFRDDQVRRRWRPRSYSRDRSALVLGLGQLGGAVARAFVSLGWRVAGWSRSGRSVEGVEPLVGRDQLEDRLSESSAVVCLLPLTADTEGLLDASLFRHMRPHSLLVNVGRGRHLVESDLLTALDRGCPGHAWLDVFDAEPLPESHPFWAHPRITITPHIASLTDAAAAAALVADAWRRLHSGLPAEHAVDPMLGY